MPLPKTEAFVFDYIKYNPDIRQFWETKVEELKSQGLDDFVAAEKLAEILIQVYTSKEALDDLLGLVDQIDLMTMDWTLLAAMLLGRDIEAEIRASVSKPIEVVPFAFRPYPNLPEEEDLGDRFAAIELAENAYRTGTKQVNIAQTCAALISFFVGLRAVVWLWQQGSLELSISGIFAGIVLAIICGFFVWLIPAAIIEQFRPKKPDPIFYLTGKFEKKRMR